jgi:hypothetical protein
MDVFQREEHVLAWLGQVGLSVSESRPNKVPLSLLRSERRNLRELHSAE